jgi:hypothetical protein
MSANKPRRLRKSKTGRYWSRKVTQTSNALDLEPSVFKLPNAWKIAASLQRSAMNSKRRKGTPYQSAISMLNFYINRAGKNLPAKRRHVLDLAKAGLRRIFGRG